MELFTKIGRAIDDRWRALHYDTERLPDVARAILEEEGPASKIAPADVFRWLCDARELPVQDDPSSRFGQPPITVYRNSRISVEVLFWMDGTTTIHQHAFAGAFHVLWGSSIHSRYRFDVERRVNDNFLIGALRHSDVELLRRGTTRPILPGNGSIHALFHLDRPSVTLVARSNALGAYQPQYNYVKPHFAVNPYEQDPLLQRRLEILAPLYALEDRRAFDAHIEELFRQCDLAATLKVLEKLIAVVGSDDWKAAMRPALDAARRTHGSIVDRFELALEELVRQNVIVAERKRIRDPEQRFYMACLLNAPTRDDILKLLRERYPGEDPVERVIRFANELNFGSPTAQGDDTTVILRYLLRGFSGSALLGRLREDEGFDPASLEENRDTIEAECRFYRTSPFFDRLLS